MATIRENHQVDEEFHEETPQEFAAEPDRAFSKVSTPGSEDAPGSEESAEDTGERDAKKQRDGQASGDE